MSESVGREWRFYIDDMIGFAEKVTAYTAGMDQSSFVASGLVYDATLRNLELIGEAATRIPEAVRASHPTTTPCGASSCRMCPPCCPSCLSSRTIRHEPNRSTGMQR
jgi:hypothetical protein